MSRPLRLLVKGGWYHVTARGNERRAIFRGDGDCARFLEMLGELPERYGVRVAACVLMGNHDAVCGGAKRQTSVRRGSHSGGA